MAIKLRFALAIAVLMAASGCASLRESGTLDLLWRQPERHDGRMFNLSIYPYDLGGTERVGYAICFDECTRQEAIAGATMIRTNGRNIFDGYTGNAPVRVLARFSAECFTGDYVCVHYFYIFDFVELN